MKIVLNIVGALFALFGALWFSQGMNWIRTGAMAGHRRWVLIGGVLFFAGIVVLIWGNTRKKLCAKA